MNICMLHENLGTKPCMFTVPDAHIEYSRLSQATTTKDIHSNNVPNNNHTPPKKVLLQYVARYRNIVMAVLLLV